MNREDQEDSEQLENDSDKDGDVRPSPTTDGPRDADAQERTLFDGPFAVVVPTAKA